MNSYTGEGNKDINVIGTRKKVCMFNYLIIIILDPQNVLKYERIPKLPWSAKFLTVAGERLLLMDRMYLKSEDFVAALVTS